MQKLNVLCIAILLFISCNNQSSSPSSTNIDYEDIDEGGKVFRSYCLTCHGFTQSGGMYNPATDSMYHLLQANQFVFNFSKAHHVLLTVKDSFNIENIKSYLLQNMMSFRKVKYKLICL